MTEIAPTTAPARLKPKKWFLAQPNMMRVVYSLMPILAAGIFFFGWRVLAVYAVCLAAGLFTEHLMTYNRKTPISRACLVTCTLFALSLPPTMPYWMAIVGIVVAILFGKEVFGGFGRNFANPAIVGRAFIYVCFPVEMTGSFAAAYRNFPVGLARWLPKGVESIPLWPSAAKIAPIEAITAATPMLARRDFGFSASTLDIFFGRIGGAFQDGSRVLAAGSIGEVCAPLIILAGIYLIYTKTANWRLALATLVGALAANIAFLLIPGSPVPPVHFTLFSGALLYGAVFMVTDPVSAPKRPLAMIIYGIIIGVFIVFLRWKAQFVGAVAFAILIGNIIGPLLDLGATELNKRKKTKLKPASEGDAQ